MVFFITCLSLSKGEMFSSVKVRSRETNFKIRAPRTDGRPYVLRNFASYPKILSLDFASGDITVMTQLD